MKTLQVLVALAILGLSAGGCRKNVQAPPLVIAPTATPTALSVHSARVERRTLTHEVKLIGGFEAVKTVKVSSGSAGVVADMYVKEGDRVQRGELLFRLDDSEPRYQLQLNQAALQQARARIGLSQPGQQLRSRDQVPAVNRAKITMDYNLSVFQNKQALRKEELVSDSDVSAAEEQYLTSKADYAQAHEQVDQDLASVASAQANVDLARTRLERCNVYSPMAGRVQDIKIEDGGYATLGGEVLTLVDDGPLYLTVNVPERYASELREGGQLTFASESLGPNRRAVARIVSLGATADTETLTLKVRAMLEHPPATLRPGMSARITLQTGRRTALLVPQSAVLVQSGSAHVYRLDPQGHGNYKPVAVPVKRGERFGSQVEVTAGLRPGQLVATDELLRLSSKEPVRLANQP